MSTTLGRDTSCTTDLRTGRTVTGARLIAEAAFRRLSTPRGMLRGGEDEANYGFDLTTKIGSTTSNSDLRSLPSQIKGEVRKDERIEDVQVVVTKQSLGPGVYLVIDITIATADGPFALKLGVSEVTVALLGIQEAA